MDRKRRKRLVILYIAGALLALALLGNLLGKNIARKKIAAALQRLPPAFQVTYSSIQPEILGGTLTIRDLHIRLAPDADSSHRHDINLGQVHMDGINFFNLIRSQQLHIRRLFLMGCRADLDDYLLEHKVPMPKMTGDAPVKELTIDRLVIRDLQAAIFKGKRKTNPASKGQAMGAAGSPQTNSVHQTKDQARRADANLGNNPTGGQAADTALDEEEDSVIEEAQAKELHAEGLRTLGSVVGNLEIDAIHIADVNAPIDTANLTYGEVRAEAKELHYVIPGAYQKLNIKNLHLDGQEGTLTIDSVHIIPTLSRDEIGKIKGHQVDIVRAALQGIEVQGLKFKSLLDNRLIADRINIHRNHIYVYRDRRLALAPDEKPMPVDFLKSLSATIRVNDVRIGATEFAYEEYPNKGNETGTLRIERLNGNISPLINHPREGDPAYMIVAMEGSLMGSGIVRAVTKMPLRKGDPYLVEGTFHDLDVTTLNPAAENLGRLHLESGMLNKLDFQFSMTEERSTGKIVGEYHNLVVDKLKDNAAAKKIDKFKSFALKNFIIPRDKDKMLPEGKRTGKVDYKRDPNRYYSYYLLHSLLVGVKASFSLGFLLPG